MGKSSTLVTQHDTTRIRRARIKLRGVSTLAGQQAASGLPESGPAATMDMPITEPTMEWVVDTGSCGTGEAK